MASRQEAGPLSTKNTDECVHSSQLSTAQECEFKILTGDIFKEQLKEQLNGKTGNLLEENTKLKEDTKRVHVLQKLYGNVCRQVSLQETQINQQKVSIATLESAVGKLSKTNRELQVTVGNLTERNKELEVKVEKVNGQNEVLKVTVSELQSHFKDIQSRMKILEDKFL